jgi:hypothetical protein
LHKNQLIMNAAATKQLVYLLLILTFSTSKSTAQRPLNLVNQDPKIEALVAEKRKINTSITITDKYKIQLFSGESETAKKTLVNCRKEFKYLDATIVFSTPSYKVWIGNFKSRLEAEKNLLELKKKYPNAFIIRPNK